MIAIKHDVSHLGIRFALIALALLLAIVIYHRVKGNH